MRAMVFSLLLWLCLACSASSDVKGEYAAAFSGLSGEVDVLMALYPDGSGEWEVGGESVPFLWSEEGDIVTVHVRGGGVVEASVEGHGLRVDVPGVGNLFLVRKE